MASKDVRDILGIEGALEPQARPAKKAKKESKPRRSGFHRELESLFGERAAPPSLVLQAGNLYKKPKKFRPTHLVTWDMRRFVNQARGDGLMLKHWRKNLEPWERATTKPQIDSGSLDDSMHVDSGSMEANQQPSLETPNDASDKEPPRRKIKSGMTPIDTDEYRFASNNYQVKRLEYGDELYNTDLKSEDWGREETDYLVSLYADYYGKWPVIYDRWDFKPPPPTGDLETDAHMAMQNFRKRTLEDLKARYYEVAAKVMAANIPQSHMTAAEFERYETMLKFDSKQETERKKVRAAMLSRTLDEKREEEFLVAELRRIYLRQERFGAELKDLRERLDHSLTDTAPDAPVYQTSQEINALLQKMLANDKNKKRQSITQNANAASPSTAAHASTQSAAAATTPGGSTTSTAIPAHAKGPAQRRASTAAATPGHRQLSPRSEARFGVSTHDRLTSGVTFRSDKLLRARQVKSTVQTQKIAVVLAELGIPDLLQMPTVKVCSAMEKLIQRVNLLLDTRKIREKEENEVAIARQEKAIKEGKPAEDETDKGAEKNKSKHNGEDNNGANVKRKDSAMDDSSPRRDGVSAAQSADDAVGQDELTVNTDPIENSEMSPTTSAPQTRANQTRRTKRSASVLSASSTGSAVSKANSKRQKNTRS